MKYSSSDIEDDLHYQIIRRLEKEGLITLKELYIDGTKIKANANRYTFVWRGSINYHLARLLDKIMKINEQWEQLRKESHRNIESDEGILKRQIRSIQTEGHFGDIKGNEDFRRFHYQTEEKVYKEFLLYAMGRNINKYHRFLNGEIQKFEGKREKKTA